MVPNAGTWPYDPNQHSISCKPQPPAAQCTPVLKSIGENFRTKVRAPDTAARCPSGLVSPSKFRHPSLRVRVRDIFTLPWPALPSAPPPLPSPPLLPPRLRPSRSTPLCAHNSTPLPPDRRPPGLPCARPPALALLHTNRLDVIAAAPSLAVSISRRPGLRPPALWLPSHPIFAAAGSAPPPPPRRRPWLPATSSRPWRTTSLTTTALRRPRRCAGRRPPTSPRSAPTTRTWGARSPPRRRWSTSTSKATLGIPATPPRP